jgi:hypothetical protein
MNRRDGITTHLHNRSFDQLVQFASIQPNAPAGWAAIDFDALASGHDEVNVLEDRAGHAGNPLCVAWKHESARLCNS